MALQCAAAAAIKGTDYQFRKAHNFLNRMLQKDITYLRGSMFKHAYTKPQVWEYKGMP